jgi:dipeptidyl aminopeptidase/acylaminoacyl peptidase
MPQGMILADGFAPRFSDDGKRVHISTGPPPPPPAATPANGAAAPPAPPAPLRVDIWNYQDGQLQPMQQVLANQERNRTFRAIFTLGEKKIVQLAAADLPTVNAGSDANYSIGTSDLKYQKEISWDQTYNDVYLVDLKTGSRKLLMEHFGSSASLSPAGKYIVYYDEVVGHWYTQRISDGLKVNLTEKLPVSFQQETHDTPNEPGSYGTAGWTANDAAIILNDRYDIWEVKPDGSGARMLTSGEGRKQNIVFRYRNIGSSTPSFPTTGTIYLSATDDRTKATGNYRMRLGPTPGIPERLIMLDKSLGAPTKAKDADVVVFTQSRFNEFPDLWVSDMNFSAPRKVSNANPQQADYVWGNAELIDYINSDGKPRRAMLIKPDNFDPSQKTLKIHGNRPHREFRTDAPKFQQRSEGSARSPAGQPTRRTNGKLRSGSVSSDGLHSPGCRFYTHLPTEQVKFEAPRAPLEQVRHPFPGGVPIAPPMLPQGAIHVAPIDQALITER